LSFIKLKPLAFIGLEVVKNYFETVMGKQGIDINLEIAIMSPEEVAVYLRKSISWVYKNWKILGGRKLGGSLFFPSKEDLYECIFDQKKGMEVRLRPGRNQVLGSRFQRKARGQAGRGQKKGGNQKSGSTYRECEDPNRHGLLGSCE